MQYFHVGLNIFYSLPLVLHMEQPDRIVTGQGVILGRHQIHGVWCSLLIPALSRVFRCNHLHLSAALEENKPPNAMSKTASEDLVPLIAISKANISQQAPKVNFSSRI